MDVIRYLKKSLENERVECPQTSGMHFIPRKALDSLITKEVIKSAIRAGDASLEDFQIDRYAETAFHEAKRLFAILTYTKNPQEICRFLEEGITDSQLPFQRSKSEEHALQWVLELRSYNDQKKTPIKSFEHWSRKAREKFCSAQWLMTSPVFKCGRRYHFDDNVVLPFMFARFEEKRRIQGGGYSDILIRKPYPSHHNFWDSSDECENLNNERLVAIKRLFTTDETEVANEIEILERLGDKHAHLIKLYAAYKQHEKWHLILPYADTDLDGYWEKMPTPIFRAKIKWSLKQMYGLAQALSKVHTYQPSHPLEFEGKVRVQDDATLSVQRGEEIYGRHGDLKPANILWFSSDADAQDEDGILKIADFG
ncbi:MAG: hypothetical protein Q9157_007100 [Trypethelium eluteriae]